MVNKVILIGNLGRDPEVRHLDGGGVVARFPLATNENYQDKEGVWQKITDWHNIVIWGRNAERAEKYLRKGYTIFVEGKLRTRKWQDSEGKDRYTTEVNVLSYKVVDKKEGNADNSGFDADKQVESPANEATDNASGEDKQRDDLPF